METETNRNKLIAGAAIAALVLGGGGLIVAPARAFPAPEALLRQADAALYAAKRAGRGRTVAQDWRA